MWPKLTFEDQQMELNNLRFIMPEDSLEKQSVIYFISSLIKLKDTSEAVI